MKGTVRKKAGRSVWSWQFRLPDDPVTGKRRFATGSGYRLQSEADAALVAALAEHGRGERVDRSNLTLAQYLTAEWLTLIAANVKPSTLKRYQSLVAKVVAHTVGGQRLQAVTAADVQRLLADLRKAPSARGKGTATLSPTTVQHVARMLSKAYADAVLHGYVNRNPTKGVRAPARPKPTMTTWEPEAIASFLRSADVSGDRWLWLWALLASTGMRRGEALGLTWGAVDLDAGHVTIRQSLLQSGISTPKTDAAYRVVDLEPEVVAGLRAWRKRQLEERLVIGAPWPGGDFVWTDAGGSVLGADSCAWWWEVAVKASGLPPIRLHDLRHSWATNALQAGVNPVLVSERLGHAKVSITLDVYSHALPRWAKAEASRVNGAIFGRGQG
jgi:integrase